MRVFAVVLLGLCAFAYADQWAVLVAGSNTWDNYRHQADVCHAYQILHKWGIPDEHIIVFMYDDIANNTANPYPGTIINIPQGPDVYAGVPHDYTKKKVTPENFIAVLTGDTTTLPPPNKVLKSGPNDHVFIYFADHGGTDLICFPSSNLYNFQLYNTLQIMYEKKMYGKLTFYMEACESGSMFDKLLSSDMNIYAQTAANPKESSFACDYERHLKTYTNDCWSITWLQDAENNDPYKETLQVQYENVHAASNQSEACQYGDLTIPPAFYVSDFMADNLVSTFAKEMSRSPKEIPSIQEAVSSRDVDLALLLLRNPEDKEAIEAELGRRALADARAFAFYHKMLPWTAHRCEKRCDATCLCMRTCYARTNNDELCSSQCCNENENESGCYRSSSVKLNEECYMQLVSAYSKHCGDFTAYSLKHTSKLAQVCSTPNVNVAAALNAISQVCSVSL